MPTVVSPGKFEVACRFLGYLCIAAIGIWVALQPFESNNGTVGMSVALGRALSFTWAALMATAFPAAVSSLFGRYRIEFICLPVFGSALILATGFVWAFVPVYPALTPRVLISTFACLQLAIRYRALYQLTRQGGKRWKSSN